MEESQRSQIQYPLDEPSKGAIRNAIKDILDIVDLTNYSNESTITGWASFTTKSIRYKKVGKTVFVYFHLDGPSNATSASFTLPYPNATGATIPVPIVAEDNSVFIAKALAQITADSSTIQAYTDGTGAGWTAANTKIIIGQIFYETIV